jgi:hypothetical protein
LKAVGPVHTKRKKCCKNYKNHGCFFQTEQLNRLPADDKLKIARIILSAEDGSVYRKGALKNESVSV